MEMILSLIEKKILKVTCPDRGKMLKATLFMKEEKMLVVILPLIEEKILEETLSLTEEF